MAEMTAPGWVDLTEEMAAEANQLACSLVGMPECEVNEVLLHLREQFAATLSNHLGRKRALIVARAFTRLIKRQRVEFLQLGFVDSSRSTQ